MQNLILFYPLQIQHLKLFVALEIQKSIEVFSSPKHANDTINIAIQNCFKEVKLMIQEYGTTSKGAAKAIVKLTIRPKILSRIHHDVSRLSGGTFLAQSRSV